MPAATVTDLNVPSFYVSDLARQEAFCREQLGFGKCGDMEPGILMSAGGVTLFMEGGRNGGPGWERHRVRWLPQGATGS